MGRSCVLALLVLAGAIPCLSAEEQAAVTSSQRKLAIESLLDAPVELGTRGRGARHTGESD